MIRQIANSRREPDGSRKILVHYPGQEIMRLGTKIVVLGEKGKIYKTDFGGVVMAHGGGKIGYKEIHVNLYLLIYILLQTEFYFFERLPLHLSEDN